MLASGIGLNKTKGSNESADSANDSKRKMMLSASREALDLNNNSERAIDEDNLQGDKSNKSNSRGEEMSDSQRTERQFSVRTCFVMRTHFE